MRNLSDDHDDSGTLREKLIGLGERSFRKSYYPQLQGRLDQLERFRALLDHTRDIILMAKMPSSSIVDANASACRLLGYSAAELQEKTIEDLLDTAGFNWPAEGCLPAGQAAIRPRQGQPFPVEFTLCVDRFGTDSYLVVVARDITERLRAEAEMKQALAATEEARDKIDTILRSVADGLIVTDPADRVMLLNRAAETLLAIPQAEIVGHSMLWLIRRRIHTVRRRQLPGVDDKSVFELEIPGDDPRHPRLLLARRAPIRDRTGKETGTITILQDITRESEIDRMKTEFISTAAHEFRTPLASILGFSELLLTRDFSPVEGKEFLCYIHEKASVLTEIVNDLLDIARIEAGGRIPLHRSDCTARELIEQVVPYIQGRADRARFDIAVTGPDFRLRVDRDKIGQVLENLLSNAVKYSSPGSPIRIVGAPAAEGYEIAVVDRGIGMTSRQVERIFDKFYRADASNRAVAGVGLGMNIARSIIHAHGGRIWVDSAPGDGTTVHFTLPSIRQRKERSQAA